MTTSYIFTNSSHQACTTETSTLTSSVTSAYRTPPEAVAHEESIRHNRGNDAVNNTDPLSDKPAALARIGGDDELYLEIFELFLEDTPEQLEVLKSALEEDNVQESRRAVHSLKASAASVGAAALSAQAAEMERLTTAGKLTEVKKLLPLLLERFSEVQNAAPPAKHTI